ncbi:MAG: ABC transporter substrate-binding protein [Candidatus Kariarchaeaceae archaeon]|jgi:ABC-type transport system substrate-binding protein
MNRRLIGKVRSACLIILLISTSSLIPRVKSQDNPDALFDLEFLLVNRGGFQFDLQRIEYAKIIAADLLKLGINVIMNEVGNFTEWYLLVNGHKLPPPYPTASEGGFDIAFAGVDDRFTLTNTDIAGFGATDYDSTDRSRDLVGYNNPEYIDLIDDYLIESDRVERLKILNKIQQILYQDLPVIGILNDGYFSLVSPEVSLSKHDLLRFLGGRFIDGWNLLSNTGKQNITIGLGPYDLSYSPWNFFTGIPRTYRCLIPNLVFQSLYQRNQDNIHEWIPLLAESMPEWSLDHKTATIKIHDNITFSDGVKMTSADVVNSYKTYLTPTIGNLEFTEQGNVWVKLDDFFAINSIIAIDEFTIQFEFEEFFNDFMTLFEPLIFPQHIYGAYDNQTIPAEISTEEIILNQYVSSGYSEFMIGSSPFNISTVEIYDIGGGDTDVRMSLERRNNYWMNDEINFDYLNIVSAGLDWSDGFFTELAELQRGDIDFYLPFELWYPNQFSEVSSLADDYNVIVKQVDGFFFQMMMPNNGHPIFGSGIDTPLGKKDPSRAPEAALYIRTAFSHSIDRQGIIDELYGGVETPTILPMARPIDGFNESLTPHPYDLDLAKEYLKKAGYFAPDPSLSERFRDALLSPIGIFSMVVVFSVIAFFAGNKMTKYYRARKATKEEAKQYLDEALRQVKTEENE